MAGILQRARQASEVVPVYAYSCRLCSKGHDRHHGFDEKVTDLCGCGGELRKVFHLSGVTFNGTGFYRNDSQPKSENNDR